MKFDAGISFGRSKSNAKGDKLAQQQKMWVLVLEKMSKQLQELVEDGGLVELPRLGILATYFC